MQDGITGSAWNTDNDSINNCVFEGNLEGNNAGGIAGYVNRNGWGGIKNCLNKGNIVAYQSSGGIVGVVYTNVYIFEKCSNYGKIMGEYSGGIIR